MKKVTLLLALGLSFGLFTACSSPAPANNASTTNTNAAKTAASPAATAAATPAAGAAGGETFTHEEGGIQFTVPAGWQREAEGGRMVLTTPDDEIEVVIFVPNTTDFDAATEEVVDDLNAYLTDVKATGKGEEGTHNGMKTYTIGGTGNYEGKPNAWELSVVGAKKPVYFLFIATPEHMPKHQANMDAFIKSIRPIS